MKKVLVVLAVVILSTFVVTASAKVTQTEISLAQTAPAKELGVTFDLTYMSKYMSWGAEGYGQQGGLFETIIIDLWGTGFGFAIGHQGATSSGYEEKRRMNYNVFYTNKAFKDSRFKMNYKFNWRYEHYYGRSRKIGNAQEWTLSFSFPEILQIENLAPYYIFDFEYPSGSDYGNSDTAGAVHIFGLAYKLKVDQLSNPLKLTIDTTFRDGQGGPATDNDWSHVTLGIGTKFNLSENVTLIPALYHQITMDKSVCARGDVTYAKISLQYKF